MNGLQIQTIGRRYYLTGNTFPVKDALRGIGCHWDSAKKAWWTSKLEALEALVAEVTSAAAATAASLPEAIGALVPVPGNTYPARDALRALGGVWDAGAKTWMVPESRLALANAAVGSAESVPFRHTSCKSCGARPNVRGWPRIYKNGICSDCYSDNE